jgi:hypothetical protein
VLGFGHIVPATELQGREYRLALDDRSMRKIKAAEAGTTAQVDDMAESATTTENKPTRGGKR